MLKNEKNDLQQNLSPFTVPTNTQLFSYSHWSEAQRRQRKPSLAIDKQWQWKNDKEFKITRPLAITDIDPGYFTDLNGRPIRDKFSKYEYVNQIRKILKARLTVGYKRDECMRIDQQFAEEQKRLSNIEVSFFLVLNNLLD